MSVLHKSHSIEKDTSPEKLAFEEQVLVIRATYDATRGVGYQPDPTALTIYARSIREATATMAAARARRLDPYNALKPNN